MAEFKCWIYCIRSAHQKTAAYGHFGRAEFPWEATDKAEILREAAGFKINFPCFILNSLNHIFLGVVFIPEIYLFVNHKKTPL